ncbi:hypothetical protein [Leptospira sp. GIMC2001]|uniref:hypothetical protein n=1 Tax=Leptospira sp. GIMC2001 TaxID=1513297 RepID=UPI0023499AE9|nr:hypothetical protein [Leptospira sp. GIMC2001]WCL49479.1 hypothetical protein O4O04_19650 [Leptospira sp. GIMC2001]
MFVRIITTLVVILSLTMNCGETEEEKEAKAAEDSLFFLLALSAASVAAQPQCTRTFESFSGNSYDMTTDSALLCSNCSSTSCDIRVNFPNSGNYQITLQRRNRVRTCGSTTHRSTTDVSFAGIQTSASEPTKTTTTTFAAGGFGTIAGITGSSFPSGTCTGGSFSFSGFDYYTVQITKQN